VPVDKVRGKGLGADIKANNGTTNSLYRGYVVSYSSI